MGTEVISCDEVVKVGTEVTSCDEVVKVGTEVTSCDEVGAFINGCAEVVKVGAGGVGVVEGTITFMLMIEMLVVAVNSGAPPPGSTRKST